MPKHSSLSSLKQDVIESVPVPFSKQGRTDVQLMIDANIRITGISGELYIFHGAGSIVNVNDMDVDYLLQKRQGGRHCCGGTGFGNQVFALVNGEKP